MLVCNVSQLARRAVVAASLTEAAAALDAPGTGNVVFATLVDDPASVRDFVDAYFGSIMTETASATATVNAGLTYAARVDEAVTALDLFSGTVPTVLSVAATEAASAADVADASVTAISFYGVLALDGPIMPATPQPTVIYIEG